MPGRPAVFFDHAVAGRALGGAEASGDLHMVKQLERGMLVAVVDGLGHGHDAQAAARLAVATLEAEADREISKLVERCHSVLNRTRGVVMSIASLDAERETLTWLAVGNVEGVLVRPGAAKREAILMRGGIVGHRLPPLRTATLPLRPGDLLVLATDGIREGFAEKLRPGDGLQEIADGVLARYGRAEDDALVLAGRWHGRPKAGAS
ncbi:MAG TPA: SpoIIE family protein phosphatase [Stellaceae bacterium]|nr:SpoIIE family protein phosphatase [Stellaceae bacterium]